MLQFKKYAQAATQLKSLGTVGEFVGVGGKFDHLVLEISKTPLSVLIFC